MRKAIVTCLFGEYDQLNPAPQYEGWDSVLFTDSIPEDPKGWTVYLVEPSGDPKKQSRYNKIMLHKVLPDYNLYCYLDANMVLLQEPPSHPIWGLHPNNHTVFQEAHRIVRLGKDNLTEVNRQINYYRGNRMRGQDIITMNGFFVRRNVEEVNLLCEMWWEQVKQFSYRDQLSLPYVFEATNRKMENIVKHSVLSRYFSIVRAHTPRIEPRPIPNVHHITSGRGDKDIGKAINDVVRGLPDEDWVCLRDVDTIPTNHREFFKQCEAIAQAGEFELVSCMTNRIGLVDQVYKGVDFEDFDMRNHIQAGIDLFEKYGNEVQPTLKSVAGIMMLFPKSIWTKVGGFETGGIVDKNYHFHDYNFSMKVKKAGGSLGIAKGVYVFHIYRYGYSHPTRHLY